MSIELRDVTWCAGERTIIEGVTDVLPTGGVVGLVGANGSGKSTLLRCLVGLRRPTAGTVLVDGSPVHRWPARRRAREIAFVEQVVEVAEDLRVVDVVGLGRTPHQDRWRGPRPYDEQVVAAAMEQVGIAHLATRPWRAVSGGERQRAHLARAFAQETAYLVLDEPTNHLDVRHQLELMEHLRACGRTVVVSLHDLGLAGRYCDHVLVMAGAGCLRPGRRPRCSSHA
ncbi:ABC transporter ATP-binding protein [Arsenicicoccus sp. oral taxon 190]|uniref:ABC transporter ATP-binding protein n=1 Tax=Arsenicicoccus sp. oral taxon 190 TaxID=1658671 RepID=UPI00067DFB42|nr:ABC transporter ATP-binding protein [Arsenicicoccus sp. oral taxon 190]